MTRPLVSINLAISADGKISSSPPRPSRWTSHADHARLLELRHGADALLVGRGTWDADRMTLTVPGAARQPLRCIVSRQGRLDGAHPMFTTAGGAIHLLATGPGEPAAPAGVTVHRGSLAAFLEALAARHGVRTLHCEGGGQLIRELAALDALDRIHLTWAGHTLFGGHAAPTATGVPGDFLPASRPYRLADWAAQGDECFLTYEREAAAGAAAQ